MVRMAEGLWLALLCHDSHYAELRREEEGSEFTGPCLRKTEGWLAQEGVSGETQARHVFPHLAPGFSPGLPCLGGTCDPWLV